MEDPGLTTPDVTTHGWTPAQATLCTCVKPIPELRGARKGAGRTYCAHCGLPVRLDFGGR
jgi:hypothetical protein